MGYYAGVLAYYWLLATPTVGFLFGMYLYVCVNLCHVHYDEAFSALQVRNFKGFCRFHVTKEVRMQRIFIAMSARLCSSALGNDLAQFEQSVAPWTGQRGDDFFHIVDCCAG